MEMGSRPRNLVNPVSPVRKNIPPHLHALIFSTSIPPPGIARVAVRQFFCAVFGIIDVVKPIVANIADFKTLRKAGRRYICRRAHFVLAKGCKMKSC